MLNKIKAAIFDMDGTLIDSMGVWSKIDIDFLEKRGFLAPENLKSNIEHLTFLECAEYFKDNFALTNTLQEIMDEWTEMAQSEYEYNIRLKPGVKEYLNLLKTLGIKISIATSNNLALIEKVLKNNEVYDYFDSITTIDEVKRGKNFPDIYLLAAKKLGVLPNECIVFEDILPAVLGAKAAGMKVIGVYDAYSDYQQKDIIKHADKYIFEFYELIDVV
ncbi:MAG: HAD family phosphatase [Clostridiaceae bacterium]|nr:HAD family phosphatase [Clostridiaceae bacterium]